MESQQPLDRWGQVIRYACAGGPMLFFGSTLVWVLCRNPDRLWSVLADVGLAVLGLVLMRWRRRWPWQIAAITAVLTVGSTMAMGPAYVAYVSLCTHRKWRQIVPIAIVSMLCLTAQYSWYGFGAQQTGISLVAGSLALGGLTVFGLYLRSHRDLKVALEEQRLAAIEVQQQMIVQAKLAERAQIAREMHDVLAHRISLLSMLAGGLAYRTNLTPEETREAALAIQENAHQSLNELRSVLGSLRSDGTLAAPQPTLDDLEALFDEVRAAGQDVEVDDSIVDRDQLPTQFGRHAYRIVQEALTNARKHAPGRAVSIRLAGQVGEGLQIEASNSTQFAYASGPGSRLGLVGLAERTRMAGGSITHSLENGRFVLTARLPWEA